MSRRPVVSRQTTYGVVTYNYLDIRENKVYEDEQIFYPADLPKDKLERRIKKFLDNIVDGKYYHFMRICEIKKEVRFFKIPIELYIATCLDYESEIEEKLEEKE